MMWLLLISALLLPLVAAESMLFKERRTFHERICRHKPTLKTCSEPFTEDKYFRELEDRAQYEMKRKHRMDSGVVSSEMEKNDRKRDSEWYRSENRDDNSDEDDDYEYYMWKKYQRAKYRRRHGLSSPSSNTDVHYHYHQQSPTYSSGYYQPSYQQSYYGYPDHGYYGSPYGSYSPYGYGRGYSGYGGGYGGGYSGYGGGYGGGGGLFSMGMGRQLGIMTPIGGFGISSGFGIGIG